MLYRWSCLGLVASILGAMAGLADPVAAQVYLLDSGMPPAVVEVDEVSGAGSILSGLDSFSSLVDLAPQGSGELFALYQFPFPAIVRVEPLSGGQILLASGGFANPSGLLNLPRRISRGAGGHVVVLDEVLMPLLMPLLIEVDVNTGAQTARPVPINLGSVSDLVVELSGDVLVLTTTPLGGLGAILRIDQTTGIATTVTSGGFLGSALAMGALALAGPNDLYVLIQGFPGSLIHVDLPTGAQFLVSTGGALDFASGLDVSAGGEIFVSSGDLLSIDPLLGIQTTISSGLFLPTFGSGPIASVGGSIFAAIEFPMFGSPTIVEVIVATGGQRAVVDASMIFPTDIAAHRLGDVYVAGMGGVLGIDPVTSAVRLVTSGGFLGFVNDLTLDPVTGDLYTLGLVGTETALIRIDPTLGSQLAVAVGGLLQTTAMNGLEMNSSGEAFVLATIGVTQSVIRVDVTTGAQTLLPSPGGSLLTTPLDLTIGQNDAIFILDGMVNLGLTGIIRKDRLTGAETLVPTGAFTHSPNRITADGQQLYVITNAAVPADRLLQVDPVTGAQAPLPASDLLMFPTDLAVPGPWPVPEPGGVAMQLAGVALLWLFARLRRTRGS